MLQNGERKAVGAWTSGRFLHGLTKLMMEGRNVAEKLIEVV